MDRTTDTDVLIKALAYMEKPPAGINHWLEMGFHTNNILRYVKSQQALVASALHFLNFTHLQGVTTPLHLTVKTKIDL